METASIDTETSKWKDKYYNALDDIELLEHSMQEDCTLFYRALTRLSVATKGYNSKLDPLLFHIREQLKRQTDVAKIKKSVEQFSESLLHIEKGDSVQARADASLLFDYLVSQEDSQSKVNQLNLLKKQYEAGNLNGTEQLFFVLRKSFSLEKNGAENASLRSVGQGFISLLKGLDIPSTAQGKANSIINILQNEQSDIIFQEAIEAAFALLQQIDQENQHEKEEMECFLAHIKQQIDHLGNSTQKVEGAVQKLAIKRNILDQTVSNKIQDLQQSSANSTKLEPLKNLIKNELSNITEQIKQHHQAEQLQQTETEMQFKKMAAEIEVVKKESQSLKESLKQASTQAVTDALTNLPNRIAYDQRFKAELAIWKRKKTPFCLLLWDIDFFKVINDTYGHGAGDKTLIVIARLLKKHCRETDFVSRFGGEEFTMILSETGKKSALILAEKIRKIIEQAGFTSEGKAINITISCGISEIQEADTQTSLFQRADKALYQAKEKGRNQCVLSDSQN